MARPSIFSSDYEKQLKNRRRKRKLIVLLVVCIGIFALGKLYVGINFKEISEKFSYKSEAENSNKSGTKVKSSEASSKDKNNVQTKKDSSSEKTVNLPDGKKVVVTYDGDGSDKKIKTVNLNDVSGEYNISPSSKNLIVYEKSGQNMFYVDLNGIVTDISYKQYVSTSGTVFSKDTVIQGNPNYIWCSSPRFIDDNNIVYISQVPWFDNRTDKYVWRLSVKDKAYANTNIHGNDVKINGVSDKGIQIVTDAATQYMKPDGSVSN